MFVWESFAYPRQTMGTWLAWEKGVGSSVGRL